MSHAGERGELRSSLGNESEKCDVAREQSVSPSNASIVKFKSLPLYFEKEKEGIKPNTIRLFDKNNLNFQVKEPKYIEIENTETGEKIFRKLTDVSIWKNWYIYSWRHSQ